MEESENVGAECMGTSQEQGLSLNAIAVALAEEDVPEAEEETERVESPFRVEAQGEDEDEELSTSYFIQSESSVTSFADTNTNVTDRNPYWIDETKYDLEPLTEQT